MTSYTALPNSTYLDFNSYLSGTSSLPTGGTAAGNFTINVALVLNPANDPAALLNADWASRQQQLATLNNNNTLWSTYGADPAKYNRVLADLASLGVQTVDQVSASTSTSNGYVSTPESRTIWVQVNQSNFTTLFGPGATLMQGTDQSGNPTFYWNGNLSLPDGWASTLGVQGLWFDSGMGEFQPLLPDPGTGTAVLLPQGPQNLGNYATSEAAFFPQQIAANFYNFPLTGALWDPSSGRAVTTGTIGLVEPSVGSAVAPGDSFQTLLTQYRTSAGISTPGVYTTVDGGGQTPQSIGERSLDVGIVTATNPQSPLVLYAGSGSAVGAQSEPYTAYQSSFWDTTNNPQVVTSSYRFNASEIAPDSPFLLAARELFVDAALRNISVFSSSGDGGSGYQYGNGATNVSIGRASPYGVMVGGTSASNVQTAVTDPTLTSIVAAALAGDPATLWQLIASGMTTLPVSPDAETSLIETAWNTYTLTGTTIDGYLENHGGNGGVDPTQPVPSYQTAFGLRPTTSDPSALVGRGVPDVSAMAGGNTFYEVPKSDMTGLHSDAGTSAATPLWATLVSQIDAVFQDQGLPQLGYMNDLLYIAAVIAPGSFNDITLGNNTSSFTLGGSFTDDGVAITPTGYGYTAGPGYDLTTGLGSPNGVLLARALTEIAHSQTSFSNSPDVIDPNGPNSWVSGANQSLLFQTMSSAAVNVKLFTGSGSESYTSAASSPYAWTSQLAEQSLQPDFDPHLVTLFDKQTQGALAQSTVSSGDIVAVNIDAATTKATRAGLSTAFGFADFFSGNGDSAVRVARPVAVAETAGGQNDQNAVVRLRSDGQDSLSVEFYRVDDMSGTINGLQPGQAGYAAAADARAYSDTSGDTLIKGPSYGNYEQTELMGVNAGDLIAMKLVNNSHGNTYWGFAQANETVNGASIGHLWNYGVNTWGWEDGYGGGDRDYNDLIVGVDFTSASGHGLLK